MKKLLTILILLLTVIVQGYAKVDLGITEEALNEYYGDVGGSTLSEQTITFNGGWKARGWNFYALGVEKYVGYAQMVVKFSSLPSGIKLILYYKTEASGDSELSTESELSTGSETQLSVDIPSDAIAVCKIVICNYTNSDQSVTLTEAYATGLQLKELDAGWNSTYAAETKTISFTNGWAAKGWNINSDVYNDKESVSVKFTAVTYPVNLVINYIDTNSEEKSVDNTAAAGETVVSVLIPSDVKTINSIILKNATNDEGSYSLTLTDVVANDALTTGGTRLLYQNPTGLETGSYTNHICSQWKDILQDNDIIKVTVESKGNSDWPKVVMSGKIGDGEINALMNDVSSFPHVANLSYTSTTVNKANFDITGSDVTISKVELYRPNVYTLTKTAENGSITVLQGETDVTSTSDFVEGTQLSLTATPATGYDFTSWTVGEGSSTDKPLTHTMTADISITANFTPIPAFSLDGFSPLAAESPKTTPTYNTTTHVFTAASDWTSIQLYIGNNSTYSGSKLVVKTQEEAKLRVTVYYVGGGNAESSYSTATKNHVVEIDSTKKIEKVIIDNTETGEVTLLSMVLDPTYTLTKSATTNGSFTVSTDGGTTTTDETSFAYGTTLTFTATADEGYTFSSWSDEATENPHNVVITDNLTIGATFAVGKTVQTLKTATQKMISETVGTKVLIANSAFANVSAGDIITVSLSEVATTGAFIVLKENSSGTSFFGSNYSSALTSEQTSFTHTLTADDITLLTGDNKALCVTGEGFTCGNITITSAGSITADAAHTTMYVLSVTQPTEGGTIQIGGSNAAAQKAYDNGSQVTLTAVRDGGYALSQWTKDEANAGSESTLSVTFAGADIAVTATFVEDGSDPNVIWDGDQEINWSANPSKFVQIAANKFTGMNLGDKLIFTITNSANNGQLQLTNSSWSVMAGTANTNISEGMTQVVYYVNNSMLAELANGLIISGVGFNLTQVKKEAGDGGDYTNAVWIGEKEMGTWGNQGIDKSVFEDAVENQLLRINYKGLSNIYAQIVLLNKSTNAELTTYDQISGIYKQYTIDATLLDVLKNSGLTIAGSGFTLASVEVIDPSTIKDLTLSVPVTNDRIWNGNPTITISVTNNEATSVTAKAEIRVSKDNFESYTTVKKNEEIASGETKSIDFSFDAEAGFYRIIPVVNGEMASNEFVIGVNPTSISSPADKQGDFTTFWNTAKTQLAAIEATDEPVLTEITSKSTAARKVYLVEFKSVADGTSGDGVTVRGYYCEPTDGEKHPVIMHYLGYDSGYAPGGQSGAPYCPSGDANPDYAEFYLSTRGQSINNRPAADRDDGVSKDFTNTYGDWFAYNFGSKDSWYYRGAYMDCVRAIDFMATRSTSDMDNLFAEGQSQGGALTYAAAALSGRTFKAIAPAITFMGDFPDYFEIASWPASVARANQGTMTDAEMYAFLSYFDTKNLAPQVNCPVITSIGVQDNVCPPHTNIAPYNNLPSSVTKQIVYNPELQHATNSDWYTTYMNFFKNYETAAPSNRVDRTMLEKSLDIADGDIELDKVLFKNAASGDVIKIYANLSTGAKIALEPSDYSGALDGANWPDFTESPFTLKLTSAALTKIKEKGLLIRGEKFTFTKAVLYTENELGEVEGDDDDEEKIIDEKTGEADLTELAAQDGTKTTLTQNEDGSITMTTTEAYAAAQIWFNNPEPVAGNVLKVDLAESKVNVTVTVKYTDGTESQMSANTTGVAAARAATRSDSGTTIEVPLETGKEVQNIEVKNNVAGTITIKKMQVTTINVFTSGVANLAMLKPQSNATYDTSTHTLATTKGWTGATISPVAGENVSGKELLIEFTEAKKVKVSVKYRTDVEGPSKIMEKAATSVRLTLDNTKNIQEISIQPTEASIVTFKKIAVNTEESDDGTLKPGKSITLWESAAGETLTWNEVAHQDATIGEMLQEYDELLITVSGVTEGCDWPKLFLRDADSEQAGNEVLLNDIASFPYTVRIVLTGEMAQQLADGFSICGDGVTVTKLVAYRPETPKTGDIHLADLNYGYNSSYDKGTHTITTTSRWAARGWEIGDKRYNDKNLITVKFEAVDFPVTLKMEYTTGLQTAQATSVGVPAGRTELLLEIPSGISKLNRVYIIYENPGSLKLTEASVTYQDKLKLSTAIEAFEAEGVIHDGRYDTDGWYNLRGMRIQEPKTSGIYIHGGKKVVIY